MIKLSEYLGYLFKEISDARRMADEESHRIAKIYQKDELLQNFSIPRFRMPEVNLNIPLCISKLEYQELYDFKLLETTFNHFFKKRIKYEPSVFISNSLKKFYKKITYNISDSFDENFDYKLKIIESEFDNLIRRLTFKPTLHPQATILESQLREAPDKSLSNSHQEILKKEFIALIKASFLIRETKLKDVLINPETEFVNHNCQKHSVFQINAKIIEEGFILDSIKDEDGTKRNIVNFD